MTDSGINEIVNRIELTTNDSIIFRTNIVEFNGRVEKILGIKFSHVGDHNVVKLNKDTLAYVFDKKSVSYITDNIVGLSDSCKDNNIDFLCVQTPYKIDRYSNKEKLLSGYEDYSNENANKIVEQLKRANVDTIDLRENVHDNFNDYLSLFYKTDHHWLPTTGLWAAGILAENMNERYEMNINMDSFNGDKYYSKLYKNYFLGSEGRKLTLGFVPAEDFALYYPKFDTNLHVQIPTLDYDKSGSYENTVIDKKAIRKDYYNANPYDAYGFGDKAIIKVDNLNSNTNKEILIIKDSYGDTLWPFLALGADKITVLDTRHFNGSLESYIKKNKPDLVVFTYNVGSIYLNCEEDKGSHLQLFDLR